MSIPTREIIEQHIETAIEPYRETIFCEYMNTHENGNGGEFIGYSRDRVNNYLLTKDLEWTKTPGLNHNANSKEISMYIGRTNKHLIKLTGSIFELLRYSPPAYSHIGHNPNFIDHNGYPQIMCWPNELEATIKRWSEHYSNGFITIVGQDLSQAFEKVYPGKLSELSKLCNTRILSSSWGAEIASVTTPITHGFWYKIIPRECYIVDIENQYDVKLERILRSWSLSIVFKRSINIIKNKELFNINDIPGLGTSRPSQRWQVL